MNTPGQQIAAGGDDKTISVLLEELPQLAQNVHQLGGDCGSLPLPLGGIAAQLMLFLGTNEHGRQASVMTTSAAATLGERAVKLEATASAIDTCSKGYHQAEEAAKGLFNRIGLTQDGKMPNGMSQEEWMRNALMHPQGAFNDMWSWEKYELGYSAAESIFGWGMRSGNPYIMGFSALTAITLFGATAYQDMRANPEMARRRIARKLEKMGIPREIAERIVNGKMPWLGKKEQDNKNRGELKNWHRDKAEPTDKMPRTRADIAQNMERVSKGDLSKKYEGEDKDGKGYSGIEVQVYRDPQTGRKIVYAYIPGTDFSNKPGEPDGIQGTLQIGADTPNASIQNSHIMMRALDRALRDQGVTSADDVILVGHSQGAAIAYNAANNNEFASRYHVSDVYTFGGPVQALPDRGNKTFRVHQTKDKGDPIPAIISGQTWKERPGDSTVITDRRSFRQGGDPKPHEMTHDMRFYRESLERDANAQKPMAAVPQGNYTYEGGNVYNATSEGGPSLWESGAATLSNERGVNPQVLGNIGVDLAQNKARSWTPDFLKPSMDALDPRKPVDYTDPKISGLPAPVQNPGTADTQHSPAAWHAPESLENISGPKPMPYSHHGEGIIPSGAGSHAEPYYAPRLLDDLHLPKLDIPHSTGGGENLLPNLDLKTQEGYLPPLGEYLMSNPAETPRLHIPQNQLQPDGETVTPADTGSRMPTNTPDPEMRTSHNPRLLGAPA